MKTDLIRISKKIMAALMLSAVLASSGCTKEDTGIIDPVYNSSATADDSYQKYISKYSKAVKPVEKIEADGTTGILSGTELLTDVIEVDGIRGLLLPEEGTVSYDVTVPKTGLYNLSIRYYAIRDYAGKTISRSASIDKTLQIDGKVPFSEVRDFILHRLWKDDFNVTDNRDVKLNDLKPSQTEIPVWQERVVRDVNGYYEEPYYFYLTEGQHTVSFKANREPVVFASFAFGQFSQAKDYQTFLGEHEGLSEYTSDVITLQGEDAAYKTSPTLSPLDDNTSSKVVPYRKFMITYNTIGGYNWRVPGDAITWIVPEGTPEGMYHLTFKVLQNFTRGMFTTRSLYINNEIPFDEMKRIEIRYDSDWQNVKLGNDGGAYWFHLKAGDTVTLEASVGRYSDMIRKVDEIIFELNRLYREIVMITGIAPTVGQDYLLERRIDNMYLRIQYAYTTLDAVVKGIAEIAGRGEKVGSLERMSVLLKRFDGSERQIIKGLGVMKENISSLGTWVMGMKEQPLIIDQIYLHKEKATLPKASSNFFEKLWREITLFIGSFFADTSLSSRVQEDGETITVWMSSGRDQSSVIRQLIDETFSPVEHINVDLKLVSGGVLLPATVSGNGPDVAMGVGEDLPVNWGIRNAILDLKKFSDFEDIRTRFYDSAMTPLCFGDSCYGLPEQQLFMVMFYRKDILDEIGITELPKTWDEVIDMIPFLQQKNLEFYLPDVAGGLNPVLYALIKQNGGDLYHDDLKTSALMEEPARDAFIKFTQFYADYKFIMNASFINRFRTGEMPIGISYYTEYNSLSVFAPEIRGLWGFAPIPGTMVGGVLNNTTTSNVSSAVILKSTKHSEAAWKYLKWWTSKETQVRYGRELEAILGAAARYPTANIEALGQLPWPTSDYKILDEQRRNSCGVPVVVGSYIVGRYIDNAFRAVINDKANPNDSLYTNVLKINKELERKRKEFGLE